MTPRRGPQLSVRVAGAAALLLFALMVAQSAPLTPPVPALQFCFTEAAFRAVTDQWQTAGLDRFSGHLAIDFPFLLAYGTWGYLLATRTRLFAGLAAGRRLLPWLLPVAAGLDALENLLHLHLIQSGEAVPGILFPLAGSVAAGKWLLIGGFAAASLLARARRGQGA
jgi:hypothetical protein